MSPMSEGLRKSYDLGAGTFSHTTSKTPPCLTYADWIPHMQCYRLIKVYYCNAAAVQLLPARGELENGKLFEIGRVTSK